MRAAVPYCVTPSVGRLFDAAAALTEVCMESSFEGEAALRLEALCTGDEEPVAMPLARDALGVWRSDWSLLVAAMLDSTQTQSVRAARFHASLAHTLLAQALEVRRETQVNRVGLAGGVFQNRVLTQCALQMLERAGFEVLIPKALPLNDAAISFGQLVEARMLYAPTT
jgi:hydrogenase maturation protein HypF